jgi:hypothetical protein
MVLIGLSRIDIALKVAEWNWWRHGGLMIRIVLIGGKVRINIGLKVAEWTGVVSVD